jgi:signal transduction histidine kinase
MNNLTATTNTIHDLRSCLAVMRSVAEAQMLTVEGPPGQAFASIIEQVDRMNSLLTELTS